MENRTAKKIWCSRTSVRRRSVTTENLGNERAARGSDTTPPFIVYRWISKFAFSIMVESNDLNPPTDLHSPRLPPSWGGTKLEEVKATRGEGLLGMTNVSGTQL